MASTSRKRGLPTTADEFSDDDEIFEQDVTDEEAFETESEIDEDPDYDTNPPVWSVDAMGMKQIPFKKEEKFLVQFPGDKPIDYFSVLLDNECLENIVNFTNKNALEVFTSYPGLTPKSRINKWKNLTVPEFKIFLGLLLHTGTIKLSRLNDYWKTHYLFSLPCFSRYMSRDRFLLIMRCLYFTENHAQAKND